MRIKNILLATMAGSVFLLLLQGCGDKSTSGSAAATSAGPLRPDTITVLVNNSGTVIKIMEKTTNKCKPKHGGKDGCIYTPLGDVSLVTFDLVGPRKWRFTKFMICSGDKLADCGTVSDQQRAVFSFYQPVGSGSYPLESDGSIDLTKIDDKLRLFALINRNTEEDVFYYSIEVCDGEPDDDDDDSNGPNCAIADPVMENTGTF